MLAPSATASLQSVPERPRASAVPSVLAAVRRRLAWTRYDPDDPSRGEPVDRARSLLYLYLAGVVLGGISLAVPESASPHPEVLGVLVLCGVLGLAWMWVNFDRATTLAQHAFCAAATLAITVAEANSGIAGDTYSAFYFGILLYAARYFSSRGAAAHLALAVAGHGIGTLDSLDGTVALVRWLHGSAAMALTVVVLAGARVRVESALGELSRRALTDPLTGLRNRRCFLDRIDEELARSRRDGTTVALVIGDIDFFKRVNDTFGHECGDSVLRQIGEVLRAETRDSDGVFRIGGEEFALLLPDTDAAGAVAVAEHLRLEVANRACDPCRTTMSFGVAVATPDDERSAFFRAADASLYAAKSRGRNRVVLGRPSDPQPIGVPAGGVLAK